MSCPPSEGESTTILASPRAPSCDEAVLTHCPYYSLQWGITLRAGAAWGEPSTQPAVTLTAQEDFPTNRGGLCAKGWTAAELLDHPDRLSQPLVRDQRNEPLRPATWDDALGRITAAFKEAQSRRDATESGCSAAEASPTKAYQLGKFARATRAG